MSRSDLSVFVYGTLRRGQPNAYLLGGGVLVGRGLAAGRLYDLSTFPGAIMDPPYGGGRVDPSDRIVGEVYDVTPATLVALDRLEGYDPEHEMGSHYLRRRVDITLTVPRGTCQAWIYIYNRPVAGRPLIESGDWLARWRGDHEQLADGHSAPGPR